MGKAKTIALEPDQGADSRIASKSKTIATSKFRTKARYQDGGSEERPRTNMIGCSKSPNPRKLFQEVPAKLSQSMIEHIVEAQENDN